jgi:hypothetical protein
MVVLQRYKRTVCISHALGPNKCALHSVHESAARIKDNVKRVSSFSALDTADNNNPDAKRSSKVAHNERATSHYTKMYRVKRNGFSGKKNFTST